MNGRRQFRAVCYTVEGINSFASVLFFNYLYFYFRDQFGFDNQHNLELAAFIGLIYTIGSWQGGRIAARIGYFNALKTGFGVMAAGLLVGSQIHSAIGTVVLAAIINLGMCMTWPTLEALVSEGAVAADAVGLYNVCWAGANALAYFVGGTMIEKLGYRSIFYVPLALVLLVLGLVWWMQKMSATIAPAAAGGHTPTYDPARPSAEQARSFKHMAWVANPFAYIAINTLLAVIPGLAAKFHLSPMLAGFTCSLWCFVRLGMFFVLWFWAGWHYRFRWLATTFGILVASFIGILLAPNLPVLLGAQLLFGGAIGLIYYSSLFYSMDVSDTKSEHGGIHEAAIGLGNCIGPAVGAASIQFLPQNTGTGAIAVGILLLCGFGGLMTLRFRR